MVKKKIHEIDIDEVIKKQLWIKDIYIQFHPMGGVVKLTDLNESLEEEFLIQDKEAQFILNLVGSGKYPGKKEILLQVLEHGFGIFIGGSIDLFSHYYTPVLVCKHCDSFLGIDNSNRDLQGWRVPNAKADIMWEDHHWGEFCPFCKNKLEITERESKNVIVRYDPSGTIFNMQRDWDPTLQYRYTAFPVLYKGEKFYFQFNEGCSETLLLDDIYDTEHYSPPYGPFKIKLSEEKYKRIKEIMPMF